MPNHNLNQWWIVLNATLMNKLQWNYKRNSTVSFTKVHLKISSAKSWLFCLGVDVLAKNVYLSVSNGWVMRCLLWVIWLNLLLSQDHTISCICCSWHVYSAYMKIMSLLKMQYVAYNWYWWRANILWLFTINDILGHLWFCISVNLECWVMS